MDSLPAEVVAHILNLVPVQQVFCLMRVSRKWEAAGRAVVRSKRRLGLGGGMDSSQKSVRPFPAIDTLPWPRPGHGQSFRRSLCRVTNLRVLRIVDCEEEERWRRRQHVADMLIRANCRSLQQVCLDFDFSFPALSSPDHFLPKLKQLFCYRLTDTSVLSKCPSLTSVFCYDLPASALQLLPKGNITGLKTDSIAEGSIPLLAQFQKLQLLHVKRLMLPASCSLLFDQMHDLVHVNIASPSHVSMDQLMSRLCSNNINLRNIRLRMEAGKVSDKSLVAMSRLSDLRSVELDVRSSDMTTSGLLHLLRGKCRSQLKLLLLIIWAGGRDHVDRAAVAAEARLINQELGRLDPRDQLHFVHE